jgi:NADH-quinone oxidoreductase subunit G
MGIGARVFFGRKENGILESPFAGNLIDICPTGVFTDKPSRYKGRRWDFERRPGVCTHCSLGCHTVVSARYREVVRLEARFSSAVNGYFICDRGRYGYAYANLQNRPRRALLEGEPTAPAAALQTAAERLQTIQETHEPQAVAWAGSPRGSLETLAQGLLLCRRQGWRGPVFWGHGRQGAAVDAALSRLSDPLAVSLSQVAHADFILGVGCDPFQEAPLLAPVLRQAVGRGAALWIADPRPVVLPCEFSHLPLSPQQLVPWMDALDAFLGLSPDAPGHPPMDGRVGEAASGPGTSPPQIPDTLKRQLEASRRPLVLCGTEIVGSAVVEKAGDLATRLRRAGKDAGLCYLLPEANAFGAGLLDQDQSSFIDLLEKIEAGQVRALVLSETDPFNLAPRERVRRAFQSLEFLMVLDYLATPAVDAADVFIPTQTVFEAGGTFINHEGRAQRLEPALQGGEPLHQTGEGNHPPRRFSTAIPGGESRAAASILSELNQRLAELNHRMDSGHPGRRISAAPATDGPEDLLAKIRTGARVLDLLPPRGAVRVAAHGVRTPVSEDEFELLRVARTFGTEPLSSLTPALRELTPPPRLTLHPRDAADLGLQPGDWVELETEFDPLRVQVELAAGCARGVLIVPRDERLAWQNLIGENSRILISRIRKVAGGPQ